MHNKTTPNERLFTGDFSGAFTWYVNQRGVQHYAVNTLLYLRTLKEKYVKMYEEFIMQLHIYAKAIKILAKVYLPISLIIPLRLQGILDEVKTALLKTNPDYDILIKRLHLYYDMKLGISGIYKDKNLTYIALNSETYITTRQQELRTCKRICYEFYCKEQFMVKSMSR